MKTAWHELFASPPARKTSELSPCEAASMHEAQMLKRCERLIRSGSDRIESGQLGPGHVQYWFKALRQGPRDCQMQLSSCRSYCSTGEKRGLRVDLHNPSCNIISIDRLDALERDLAQVRVTIHCLMSGSDGRCKSWSISDRRSSSRMMQINGCLAALHRESSASKDPPSIPCLRAFWTKPASAG